MSTIRFFKASTIAALAAISIAACGSNSDDAIDNASSGNETDAQPAEISDDAVVFDFTEQAVRAMPSEGIQEITFTVHPELASANQEYNDQRVLDSVTVSSWDGGESQCGIELRYEYATGAKEELEKHTYHRSLGDLPELPSAYEGPEPAEYNDHVKFSHALGGSASFTRHHELLGGSASFTGQGVPTQDYSVVQQELECATGPMDDNSKAQGSVEFRSIEWVDTAELNEVDHFLSDELSGVEGNYTLETETFAEADINVMANGDLHIADYTIHDWTQDANGDWIQSQ